MRSSPPECMLCLVEITSREVNEARRPHTCSRPCAFEEKTTKKKHEDPAAPKTHPLANAFFSSGNSLRTFKAATARKGDMSDMTIVQPTEQPRTSPPGSRGSEHMPRHPFCGCLPECSVSRAMAAGGVRCALVLSKLENFFKLDS